MFSYPDKKAVHPLLFLVELTADPRQRELTKNRLEYLLEVIRDTAEADTPFGLPVWIQTYGQDCYIDPLSFQNFFVHSRNFLLEGRDSYPLWCALNNLARDLSRNAFLHFDEPLIAPTIFLLGNPAGVSEEYSALKDLDEGPWFFHCNRFVLWDGKMKNPDFANRFVGFTPRLFQKNPRILPLGRCPQWSAFLKDFLPERIPTFLNVDALEELVHVDPAGPAFTIPQTSGNGGAPEGPLSDIPILGPGIPASSTPTPPRDPWSWEDPPIGPGIPASSTPTPPRDPWGWEDPPLGPGIPAEVYDPIPERMGGYAVPIKPEDEPVDFGDEIVTDGYIVPVDEDPPLPTGTPDALNATPPRCPYPGGQIPGAGEPLEYEVCTPFGDKPESGFSWTRDDNDPFPPRF